MRILIILVLIVNFGSISMAQSDREIVSSSKSDNSARESNSTIDGHINACEVSELPWVKRPRISLQQALLFAENYIKKERIDIARYYLYLIKPNPYAIEQGWLFRWAPEKDKGGKYIEILVSEDGNATKRTLTK